MAIAFLFLWVYRWQNPLSLIRVLTQGALAGVCYLSIRALASVYRQMWRYGGVQSYIRLLVADTCAFFVYWDISLLLQEIKRGHEWLSWWQRLEFLRLLSLCSLITLAALTLRLVYRYVYKCRARDTFIIRNGTRRDG